MMKVDFQSVKNVGKNPKGLFVTWVTNWLIKPFTMYGIAALFFYVVFKGLIAPDLAKEYLAGAVLLGAAPCTAMVFVWSTLTRGNPAYTVVQVATNDLIILVAFVPIVKFLLGVSNVSVPWDIHGNLYGLFLRDNLAVRIQHRQAGVRVKLLLFNFLLEGCGRDDFDAALALHHVAGKLVFPFVEARNKSGVRLLHIDEHGIIHAVSVKPAHGAEILHIFLRLKEVFYPVLNAGGDLLQPVFVGGIIRHF
jgi:hypothetical protein